MSNLPAAIESAVEAVLDAHQDMGTSYVRNGELAARHAHPVCSCGWHGRYIDTHNGHCAALTADAVLQIIADAPSKSSVQSDSSQEKHMTDIHDQLEAAGVKLTSAQSRQLRASHAAQQVEAKQDELELANAVRLLASADERSVDHQEATTQFVDALRKLLQNRGVYTPHLDWLR